MAQFKPFRVWAAQLCPPWLRGDWGEQLVMAFGLIYDLFAEEVRLSGEASMMESPDFAPDALQRIGLERRMPRYLIDTDATYKSRLKNAWQAWQQAGTRQGVLAQLQAMGVQATIVESFEWNWDDNPDDWSRFWVVITGHAWTQTVYGVPNYGDCTYGSNMTVAEVEALRKLVRQWKPAHVRCQYLIVVFDEVAWAANQPDGSWQRRGNRNRAAIYIPG
jgi:hypothetical protein